MTIENLKKIENINRGSKWDKIKKRYSSNLNLSSDTVKKFLDLNFVNEKASKFLRGDSKSSMDTLNPSIIMDLRHELIRSRNRDTSGKSAQYKAFQVENAKKHNQLVEQRMIENELTKFKMKIQTIKTKKHHYSIDYLEDDDKNILQVLRESEQMIREFEGRKKEDIKIREEDREEELIDFEEEKSSKIEMDPVETSSTPDNKNVHFRNTIKIITYPKTNGNIPNQKRQDSLSTTDTDFEFENEIQERENYFKDFSVNLHEYESTPSCDEDEKCNHCCPDKDFLDFDARRREFNIQSFHSLPNLSDEIENLLKITKFQSVQDMNENFLDECPCCLDIYQNSEREVKTKSTEVRIQRKFENCDSEQLLTIRRMEIEEKNYSQLMICNNSCNPEFDFRKHSHDIDLESEDSGDTKQDLEKAFLRIYFQKWLNFVTIEKIIKTNAFTNEDRVKKINNFLNKIRIEQNRNTTKSKNSQGRRNSNGSIFFKMENKKVKKDYEHKLKIQQDIIELQKLKLERQERMITEMKLSKFSEMLKESKTDMKNELKSAAKRGSMKLRTKARCIQMAANIKSDPEEDEKRKLLAQGLIVPRFLAKMQERAAERLMRHEEARQRRVRLEQEKEELKTAVEIAKRQEDEKAKQIRIREMCEKRRQEKIMKILKEQERQQFIENMKKAKEHYARKLMENLGFQAFRLLIRQKRTNYKKAMLHRRRTYMRRYFIMWSQHTKEVWTDKRRMAKEFHGSVIVKRYFIVWRQVFQIRQSRMLVAIDWYEMKITEKLLRYWYMKTKTQRMLEAGKMKNAEKHYNCQMKWKIFDHWRRLPAILKIEKETEVRRQKWRLKIMDILVDYKPRVDNE